MYRDFFYLLLSGMKIIIALFVSFFAINISGFCSVKNDSIPKPKVIAHRFNYDFTNLDSVVIDTLLSHFQRYNPAFSFKTANITSGNLSQPIQPLNYENRQPYEDFIFAHNSRLLMHNPDEMLYYTARKPFTVLNYFADFPGMKMEQKLNIIHTQNVNKLSNIGAVVDLNSTLGNYLNQKSSSNAISVFGNYQGKRYNVFANANMNTLKIADNGGLFNDDDYEKFSYSGKEEIHNLRVNLNLAKTTLKEQSVFVMQRYYITGSYKDDSIRDKSSWNEALSLIHTLRFQRSSRSFTDDLTSLSNADSTDFAYYRRLKLTPVHNNKNVNDSVFFRRIENSIQLAFNANQWLKIPAELRAGIKSQIDLSKTIVLDSISVLASKYKYFSQPNGNHTEKNLALIGSLTNRFSSSTSWGGSIEYYFFGYKLNDLDIQGDISQFIKHNLWMRLSGNISNKTPGYFMNHYASGFFNWNNSLKQQQSSSVRLSLAHLKSNLYIDGQLDNITNYLYFNTIAIPDQASSLISIYSLTVTKLIDWGIFHSDFKLTFQGTAKDKDKVIAVPLFSGYNSSYLALQLFAKEMKLNIGYEVYYNTKFSADAYMPVTGLFYKQSTNEIGNFPYTNLFLNIKVKRVRFFFKYEHINSLIFNQRGYMAPHYPVDPVNPIPLKFGLSWTFYD